MGELAAIALETQRRFSRAEYYALAEAGVLDDERVELIDGIIVPMSPHNPPHSGRVQWFGTTLIQRMAARFSVRVQLPLALGPYREPEPDVAIVAAGTYDDEHPTTAELVIEVAESSLRKDRAKAAMYAEAAIREYWIIDLRDDCIEVHRDPESGAYRTREVARRGGSLSPRCQPDVTLAVDEILGAKK